MSQVLMLSTVWNRLGTVWFSEGVGTFSPPASGRSLWAVRRGRGDGCRAGRGGLGYGEPLSVPLATSLGAACSSRPPGGPGRSVFRIPPSPVLWDRFFVLTVGTACSLLLFFIGRRLNLFASGLATSGRGFGWKRRAHINIIRSKPFQWFFFVFWKLKSIFSANSAKFWSQLSNFFCLTQNFGDF